MKPWMESIYYSSPVFMQNIAVSAMGWKLRGERYSEAGKKRLALLLQTQNYTVEQMYEYQSKCFVDLARHAINHTSFYRRWAEENGIAAQDIKSQEDIKLFPLIEKSYIREHACEFKAQPKNKKAKQITLHTSGTTGTPLSVYTDDNSRSEHYAFFSRLRSWYGIAATDRRATMFGRIIMPAAQKKAPFWRFDAINKNLLMSSYHLKEDNLLEYYNKLKSYKPQEIFAYPSSIVQLADFIIKNDLPKLDVKLLMTTAEHLHAHQRQRLLKAFNTSLVNQYGCTEMAFFASTIKTGKFCFHPEHAIVEVRNSTGTLNNCGEGELVVTGLINYSMPVIRYVIGDAIDIGGVDQNGFKEILDVQGRVDDVVYMKDGTPVGRLDPIFKGGSGIKSAQIVQLVNGDIVIRLIPDSSYTQSIGDDLKDAMEKRVGNGLKVSLDLVEHIESGKNGKFKSVISNYCVRN